MIKKKECCGKFDKFAEEGFLSIKYDSRFRERSILYKELNSYQLVYFCPWCGFEFEKSLREEWFLEMDLIFGEFDFVLHENKIPEKFNNDQWWKEKNL